ncbi:MAG: ferrochelatase [Bermanella sp.]|nr:ferrochelatase [Bermanella sp.]|tara:strand:- start:2844 stop:3800 length:957 start_codon:yes stop_codon:yes gene_type:complete
MSQKTAVVMVNLGTPDAPTAKAVRRYLKEFLWDDRVIKRNPIWWLVLNGIVLALRPKRVAKLYESIWDGDSPIRTIGFKQQEKLQAMLGEDVHVELAMTYGNPSFVTCLEKLNTQGFENIVVLPLYPQYSATTTAAIFDQVANFIKKSRDMPSIHLIKDYHKNDSYINALANKIDAFWQEHGRAEKLLFSFHGIPKSYVEKGDPYRKQVEHSVKLLVEKLNLKESEYQLCFQSRFGPTEWLQPYTDKTLEAWGKDGIRSVDVVCPAFSADCLETLEEIAEENKEIFMENGGEQYRYIPALNESDEHVAMMAELVKPFL